MDIRRPNFLVTVDATTEAIRAAKYREDVNIVNFVLLNLQYWLVPESSICCLYTDGKNFSKNIGIDVTPPITSLKQYLGSVLLGIKQLNWIELNWIDHELNWIVICESKSVAQS